ncbi:MAG: hypothetical protein K1X92_05620 [Bacteroidia bacterium]|nr:hypothetical protein [Bacteroidia bacterium]
MTTVLQRKILSVLTYPETFEAIEEEVGEKPAIIADELKIMIDKRWVQVMMFDTQKGDYRATFIFDSDQMREQQYMITAKGMNAI